MKQELCGCFSASNVAFKVSANNGTDFVFVIDWPLVKRPFYAYPSPEDPMLTNTMDLLCAGAEISSGGQRRHTYESMLEGLALKGMDPDAFTDYLSVFKYGMPLHGGFGMGLERLTMMLLGLKNIRQASLFPSDTKRIAGVGIKKKIFFGGENLRNEIIRLLRDSSIEYKTQTSAEITLKSMILRGKNSKKNYQFNIPAHLKLDMKVVADLVGEKCEFEDLLVIEERFGLKPGGVPPFGSLLNLETYFDSALPETAIFSCGLPTEFLSMKTSDLISLVQPKIALFTKS